jgi:hypothetical protein
MTKSYTELLSTQQSITDDMTVAQVYERIGVAPDADYITKGRALSEALGGDQEFEDWLVDGTVDPAETIGAINASWEEYKKEQGEYEN